MARVLRQLATLALLLSLAVLFADPPAWAPEHRGFAQALIAAYEWADGYPK